MDSDYLDVQDVQGAGRAGKHGSAVCFLFLSGAHGVPLSRSFRLLRDRECTMLNRSLWSSLVVGHPSSGGNCTLIMHYNINNALYDIMLVPMTR